MVALVLGLAVTIYGNLVDLQTELPRLIERARELVERLRTWGRGHMPAWAFDHLPDTAGAETDTSGLKAVAARMVNVAANFLAEAVVVVLYLVFLLLDVRRIPARVRAAFPPEKADQVLAIFESINRAMTSYLRAKVLASLVTALPVVVILWAFGVSFAGTWGVLAFVGNFIPYVGSLIALVLPALLALLEFGAALATSCGSGTATPGAVRDQQFHRTEADRFRGGPPSARGALRARVLGPLLGGSGDGAGSAIDGDGEDHFGKRAAHTAPRSSDGGAVNQEKLPSITCSRMSSMRVRSGSFATLPFSSDTANAHITGIGAFYRAMILFRRGRFRSALASRSKTSQDGGSQSGR